MHARLGLVCVHGLSEINSRRSDLIDGPRQCRASCRFRASFKLLEARRKQDRNRYLDGLTANPLRHQAIDQCHAKIQQPLAISTGIP